MGQHSSDARHVLTCGDDATFIFEQLNQNSTAASATGGNVEGLEQSSVAAQASSRSNGGSWMVIVGAAIGAVLVLILMVVYTYRRCFSDSQAKPKPQSSPLLPYHRPANLGKATLTRPNPTRTHSSTSSARSSLVHVPAAPSDALHERFDTTLSQLAVLHTARSPAAKFSPLGLLIVPLPDIDHLPSPDLYLTTSLASLVRDWNAIFHRLECECAQIIVANYREWPTGAAASTAAQHVNFAQYHMQRAQLMAHTMGHIWRVLVLGSPAPNALVDSLVTDMRDVLVKVAAMFPTLELVGTRAGIASNEKDQQHLGKNQQKCDRTGQMSVHTHRDARVKVPNRNGGLDPVQHLL
ncbi:hypothetical protein BCR44DRAFT_1463932 [Catenaria anguillulae PL171]|uniref:Uncharacterized protein n=1 Tax=Catenaria anguillulae PL171 TaxID=765915 RepID=A0A1Y2HBI8_9FUNG|nr:hypothetical protein BCR44DRAFT_1463932 [Catenaria anguillulae PL171]